MSRGFVKEEDQEEAPMIPPRAALPSGMTNYVTPEGLQALHKERQDLEKASNNTEDLSETEVRRQRAVIDGKLRLLNQRIASARVLDPMDQPKDEIRFGARVKIQDQATGKESDFRIVGVDEADVKKNKISFVAPLARAVTGHAAGDLVSLHLGKENRKYLIKEVKY